jgi:anionic cell wall polymer biosynthesis LytR-Cps2A-Psr (LCP) family protein
MAYSFGGLPAVRAAVTALTGQSFIGTATVRLDGLTRLVDTLGGVPYCLDEQVTSWQTHVVYQPGCRTYSGGDLRDLLRQRIGLPNGSLDRDRHNAQFLAALALKLTRGTSLLDLARLGSLYASVRSDVSVQLDGGLDPVELAWSVRSAFASTAIVGMPVVADPDPSVQLRPAQDAAGLFAALRADTLTSWLVAHRNDPTGLRDK